MTKLCGSFTDKISMSKCNTFNKIDNKLKMLHESLSSKPVHIFKSENKWFISGDYFTVSGDLVKQYLSLN